MKAMLEHPEEQKQLESSGEVSRERTQTETQLANQNSTFSQVLDLIDKLREKSP